MKGLFINNVYATLSNAKVFSGIMLLVGMFVVIMDNKIPSLIIGYMLLGMVGFSLTAIASLQKEGATKWSKYKLTAPVKRSDIVKSYFINLLLWLIVGTIFAGTAVILSIILHGFPFDRNTDIFMLFVVGIGVSLFMGAVFFPLFYLGGEERSEVFLGISLLCSIAMLMGLAAFINTLFPDMTTLQLILSGMMILACAGSAFTLSYPLTVGIFKRKEY